MFGGSKQEQLEHRLDHKLNASSDGIDMDVPAKVISSETVYTGRIFHVDDMRIALTDKQGKEHEIGRQVLRHAPCVVMLVHDMSTDRYLIEREYRAGSDMFAYGLPAGLMDEGEDIMDAALRELAEETGIHAKKWRRLGDFYGSPAILGERLQLFLAEDLSRGQTHTDEDEFLEVFQMPLTELVAKVLAGDIPDGKTQVAALRVFEMLRREGRFSATEV